MSLITHFLKICNKLGQCQNIKLYFWGERMMINQLVVATCSKKWNQLKLSWKYSLSSFLAGNGEEESEAFLKSFCSRRTWPVMNASSFLYHPETASLIRIASRRMRQKALLVKWQAFGESLSSPNLWRKVWLTLNTKNSLFSVSSAISDTRSLGMII